MEGQISSGKYTLPNFAQDLHVVLVDFETTSLNKIKAKLEKFSYQVTGVSRASEALSMIGEDKTRYRFVIANYRTLPKMDYGSFVHELWQKQIPLIWMSRSYDEAEQALDDGASFLLLEPISSKKLKPLWQFAFRRRSNQEAGGASGSAARLDLLDSLNKQVVKKEQVNQRDKEEGLITTTNNQQEGSNHKRLIDDQQGNMQDKRTRYSSELQELNQNERGRRGDGNRNENGRERPVWNSERDRKFKAAYSELGVKATAKTIHEKMNDPDITPTQVGSHLQKFKSSLQKKNVDSGATSLPVTDNSSSSLARQPGNQNLPNLTPCADQNQYLNTNFGASLDSRYNDQLPAENASMTEPLGSAQARITSAIATIPGNFPSNFSDGIQNPKPMVELGPAAGLPNIPPNANQNQNLTANFAATFNSNCKNQLRAGVATTTEPLGFEQANIITSGIATNSENVPKNFTHGMQNLQPIVEPAPAAGSSRHPAYGNQNQDLNTIRAAPFSTRHQTPAGVASMTEPLGSAQARITSAIATTPDNFPSNFGDGIQNPKPMVELGPAATFNSNYKSQLPAGVATTTETLGFEQANIITPGIATNSENIPTNFTYGMQNLQPMVELAPAAGSSRRPAYANQNQVLNTIRAAPFSTRHQSQLPEGRVARTTELVGSVQEETTLEIATNSENFLMNFSNGIKNQEPMVEQTLAAGSSNQNQSLSELPDILTIYDPETLDLDGILNSINPVDIEKNQEPVMEQTLAAGSSNQNQPLSVLADTFPTYEDENVDLDGILNSQKPGDIEQNQEPMVEQAPAAGSSNHGFSFLNNEEVDRLCGDLHHIEAQHDVYGERTDL